MNTSETVAVCYWFVVIKAVRLLDWVGAHEAAGAVFAWSGLRAKLIALAPEVEIQHDTSRR